MYNRFIASKELKLILLTTLIFAALILLAEANVSLGTDPFKLTKTEYGTGDFIEGYINISLSAQSAESNVRFSINNQDQNISLLDFLTKAGLKQESNFLCNPKTCQRTYQTIGPSSSSKKINGGITTIGAMIIGRSIEFKTDVLEFEVAGKNSTPACGISPLVIDMLADKSIDWQYLEGGDFCSSLLPSPCYDDTNATNNFDVTTTGYCQKIYLPVSNKFKLATLVKKNKGEGDLVLFLYDKKTGNTVSCNINEPNSTSYIEENCSVDFPVTSYGEDQEYYLCIRDEISDKGYVIKGETTAPLCGVVGLPSETRNGTADFALLAQPSSILPFNKTITFNETEFSKTHVESLAEYIKDYITEQYDGYCISGCLVPIQIASEQDVTIDNFAISYCAQGLCTTENNFFELSNKPASINMNATRISLDNANFSALAVGTGNQTASLYINDAIIGSAQISIEKIPIVKSILYIGNEAMEPIQFIVNAYSPNNNSIISYLWDFGDGSTETTLANLTTHRYGNVGKFRIRVEATDSQGLKGSKSQEISLGSPKDIINKTIKTKKALLNNITSKVEETGWYKDLLSKEIGLSEINDKLTEYERQYKLATSDAEYINLMTKLNDLKIPTKVYESSSIEEFPLIIDPESILPEYIEKLNGGSYDTEYSTQTKNAIWAWGSKNLEIVVSSNVLGLIKEDDSISDLATVINMRITPKESASEIFFVILLPYEKAKFASEYGQQELDGAIGFDFKESKEQNINFAIPGRIDAENLVAFGSPYLADLEGIVPIPVICNSNGKCETGENWKNCRNDCKPIGMAIFYILLLIAIMFGAYILMQRWYSTKYEKYLFKNRQDLYNISFFVGNSFKTGKQEKEIAEELKKAGWNGEQIDYAIRKVSGKPIGLPEIRIKIKGIQLAKKNALTPKA